MKPLAFITVIDSGDIEPKTTLLFESIRQFAGRLKHVPIYTIQTTTPMVSQKTCDDVVRWGGHYIRTRLNSNSWSDYPLSNKVYGLAFLESLLAHEFEVLCYLDADVICLQPPDDILLQDDEDVAICPADTCNVGLPVNYSRGSYWQFVYDVCGVKVDTVWDVETVVDQRSVKAYFNTGVIAFRPSLNIFRQCQNAFEQIGQKRSAPFLEGRRQRYFLEQACTSAIISSFPKERIKVLSSPYNYPLHLQHRMKLVEHGRIDCLDEVVFAHYHGSFRDLRWQQDFEISPELERWLLQRIPL